MWVWLFLVWEFDLAGAAGEHYQGEGGFGCVESYWRRVMVRILLFSPS